MYPDGARLQTIIIHPKWVDLMWYDPSRDVLVYLSTMPVDKSEKADTITV